MSFFCRSDNNVKKGFKMNRILLSTAMLAATMFASADAKAEATVKEGQWTVSARAGIAPTTMTQSPRMTRTFAPQAPGQTITLPSGHENLDPSATNNFYRRSYRPGFSKLHGLPFALGFDLGYAAMDNVEVFFNFDWNTAGGKKKTALHEAGDHVIKSHYKQGRFNSCGFYLGGRYFFDIDSDFSPFLGAKLGLVHRSHGKHKMNDKYNVVTPLGTVEEQENYRIPFMKSSTGFSGGLQLGARYKVTEQVSLNLMAEVIGSTALKANTKLNRSSYNSQYQEATFTKVTRKPGGTFSFPITAGVTVSM